MPLLRAAADYEAAGAALVAVSRDEWQEFVDEGGIALAPGEHATEFRMHPFRSAESLAAIPALGDAYRAASDLALPHFGTTLLLAASESTPERIAVTFGDRDFHLGLAEIVVGLLLTLGVTRVETLLAHPDVFAPRADAVLETFVRGATRALERPDRCRVTVVEHDGARRHLIVNWRRAPGAAPKRILL
jgi:hypothetical protein